MKLKTAIEIINQNRPANRREVTIEEMNARGYSHLSVEPDGTVFAWRGNQRPLAMIRRASNLDGGWYSLLNAKSCRVLDPNACNLDVMVGNFGYAPVNWHRMVWVIE